MNRFGIANTALWILASAIVLMNISCNKQLNQLSVNPNQVTLDSYFTSPEAVNAGVIAIYGYLTTPRNLGASGMKMDLSRGDAISSNADYCLPGQYNSSLNPSWYTLVQPYALMYTAALQATEVIKTAPGIAFKDTVERNAYMGEAYCLRAFSHFWLLIHYRNIALINDIPEDRDAFIRKQVTPAEAWDFIISDLKEALTLLPTKDYWGDKDLGRVTQGSAAGLLGMVYLYETGIESHYGQGGVSYYQEAAQVLGNLIEGKYGSYHLMDNYEDNFDAAHENNAESILEFQFKGDLVNTGFNPGFSNSGLQNDARGLWAPMQGGSQESVVHDWLYNAFIASKDAQGYTDKRMFGTLIFDDLAPEVKVPVNGSGQRAYRMTGPGGETWEELYPPKDGKTGFATLNRTDATPYKAGIRKWLDLSLPLHDPGNNQLWYGNPRANGANWRYIRLAGVYLMYAEAVLEGGKAGSISALQAVNRVRERAHMPLLNTLTMDDIKRERILELSLEGHRFFDLLRWGELKTRFQFLENTDSHFKQFSLLGYDGFISGKDEWLPIPIDEIESNANFKQNPGW